MPWWKVNYVDDDGVPQIETVYDRPTLIRVVTALIWNDVCFSVSSNLV